LLTGLLDSEGPFVFPFRHPSTFAIGMAWDVQPSWTLTFDWQRTAWNSFTNGIEFEDPLVPAIPNTADWENSNRFRVGVLHRLGARSWLAGGYYHAGRAVDQPDFTSVTDGDLNHLSFNFAHRWKRVRLDIGVLTGGGAATVSGNETYTGGTQLNFGVRVGR
jgi:long-subunit fatty acid transport protein